MGWSVTPTLNTERLMLVPYRAGLVTDEHIRWLNDPETVKYSEQRHHKHTIESQHAYLNEFPANSHIWLIQKPGKFDIGSITAFIDQANKIANIGILIAKEYWGKGLGLEAWKTVMDHLFRNGIRKIECGCMANNSPMQKLAIKSGMRAEAIIQDNFLDDQANMH